MEKRTEHIALKHIYLVNNNSRAAQYGIGTYIKQIVKFLQTIDCKVTIINLFSDWKRPEIIVKNEVENFNLPYPVSVEGEKHLFRYYQSVGTFLSLHIDCSADNIFHFNYLQHSFLQKVIKEQFPHSRTILTVHYLNWHFTLKGNTTQFLEIIKKGEKEQNEIERKIVKEYDQDKSFFGNVDSIICLSDYTKFLLREHYGIADDKIHLIKNGMPLADVVIPSEEERREKRRLLHIDTKVKLILFAGRLDALKGVEFLVEAFRKVLDDIPNCHLWIVGDGNYSLALKKADNIWNRITLTGKISQDVLFTLYQIADVGVIPIVRAM